MKAQVKALMVIGKEDGKVQKIVLNQNNFEEINTIPAKFKTKGLETIINRILTYKGAQNRNITLDTGLNDNDTVDDFNSLGLSIEIGIEACLKKWKWWENICDNWCFTGAIIETVNDAKDGKIDKIKGVELKLEAAKNDDSIKFVMMPLLNKEDAENWIKKNNIRAREYQRNNDGNVNTGRVAFFFKRMWQLISKNIFSKMALCLWILSLIYIPAIYLFRDFITPLSTDNVVAVVTLPVNDLEKVKKTALNKGFPEDQIESLSSLKKIKRSAKVLLKLDMQGNIEFEIINYPRWPLISGYVCVAYIIIFIIIISIIVGKRKDFNPNLVRLFLKNKIIDIVFVANIKDAERHIVEYKSLRVRK